MVPGDTNEGSTFSTHMADVTSSETEKPILPVASRTQLTQPEHKRNYFLHLIYGGCSSESSEDEEITLAHEYYSPFSTNGITGDLLGYENGLRSMKNVKRSRRRRKKMVTSTENSLPEHSDPTDAAAVIATCVLNLNSLTQENVEQKAHYFATLLREREGHQDLLESVVLLLHVKAVRNEELVSACARLAHHIDHSLLVDTKEECSTFKECLIRSCQNWFDSSPQPDASDNLHVALQKLSQLLPSYYSASTEARDRKDCYFGNMRFIGVLMNVGVLKPIVFFFCCKKLLQNPAPNISTVEWTYQTTRGLVELCRSARPLLTTPQPESMQRLLLQVEQHLTKLHNNGTTLEPHLQRQVGQFFSQAWFVEGIRTLKVAQERARKDIVIQKKGPDPSPPVDEMMLMQTVVQSIPEKDFAFSSGNKKPKKLPLIPVVEFSSYSAMMTLVKQRPGMNTAPAGPSKDNMPAQPTKGKRRQKEEVIEHRYFLPC